jgi:hypothetical protein
MNWRAIFYPVELLIGGGSSSEGDCHRQRRSTARRRCVSGRTACNPEIDRLSTPSSNENIPVIKAGARVWRLDSSFELSTLGETFADKVSELM